MRSNQRLSLASIALLAFAASCGDVAAPSAVAVVDSQPQLSLTDGSGYTGQFVIRAHRSTTFTDGVNTLSFPAGAVCDPATSSYGAGEWDKPCAPIRRDLAISVVTTVANGRVHLDFSPSIRFNPARPVWLVVRNDAVKTQGTVANWVVLFNDGQGHVIDEGATDPSLVTYVDRAQGIVLRRIKHFTGYEVALGVVTDCDPAVDVGCIPLNH